MLLGSLLASLVYSGFLPENSWRMTFLGASSLGFLGYFIRKNFNETEAFKKICLSKSFEKNPPLAALIKNPFSFFLCFLSAMFVSNFVYLGSFFFEKLALLETQLPAFETHLTIIYGQALATLTMVLVAPFIQKEKALSLCISSLGCATLLSPLMIYCSVSCIPGSHGSSMGALIYFSNLVSFIVSFYFVVVRVLSVNIWIRLVELIVSHLMSYLKLKREPLFFVAGFLCVSICLLWPSWKRCCFPKFGRGGALDHHRHYPAHFVCFDHNIL